MKKILFLTANDGATWGGSEELWYASALEFNRNNYATGICIKRHDPLPAQITKLKDSSIQFFFKERPRFGLLTRMYNRMVPSAFRTQSVPQYKTAIVAWKPDLVVISQGNNTEGLEMMNFLALHHIPYVTIVQAVFEGIWPNTFHAEQMQRGYTQAVYNYFVSADNQRVTALQMGRALPNSKVIRNPFNVPYHTSLPFPPTGEVAQMACVARYEFFAKGQDVLLEVLSDPKWKSRNLHVNFYGKGSNEEALRKLIAYFNLTSVSIKGFTNTLDIWKDNAAVILPSRFEGLPLSLVEAMLCGRFGIVTNVSGNKEALIDNVNGFLAEAPRAEYIDAAMERAWQRKSEWESIGNKAKEYIKTLVEEDPAHAFFTELKKFL